MDIKYLDYRDGAIGFERQQCREEGLALDKDTEREFDRVLGLDPNDPEFLPAANALMDRTRALPLRPDYPYHEPSDLPGIHASRPAARRQSAARWGLLSPEALHERLKGAWTGRAAGCLLGKPTEGWLRAMLDDYAAQTTSDGELCEYLRADRMNDEYRERWGLNERWAWKAQHLADRITDGMPVDDDMNYTVTGLAVRRRYGLDFSPVNVASFWLGNIPLFQTFTAERVAYRNLVNGISPPESAQVRNPYREWIGAQIRADFWGYVCPGEPEKAAALAWRDACVSHTKNGIYGEMWAAAMIAAAFAAAEDDIDAVIDAGLNEIPAACRLAQGIAAVRSWRAEGIAWREAADRIHALWQESDKHGWTHTISNAQVVVLGLLWGDGDFGKSICRAVQCGFDTDCNGATVGSVLGAMQGRRALPELWTAPLKDTLHTSVGGYYRVSLSDMAAATLALIQEDQTKAP